MPVVQCRTCGCDFKIKPVHIRPGGNCCSVACRSTGVTKNCEVCHTPFYTPRVHRDQRFCSPTCKGVAARQITECQVCGTKFYRGGGKYCSKKCSGVGRITAELRRCKVCGVGVRVTKSRLANQSDFFCTHAHANEWARRTKTTHVCKMCPNVFHSSPSRPAPTYCSLKCRDADPVKRAQLLEMNRKQQSMGESSLERVGYALLDEMGVQYVRQHVIGGKFTVDAFVPGTGVVVQWDGDYWHGHPVRFPNPDARVRRRMALDISQDAYMVKCGYRVVRVWESELKASVDAVRARLRASSVLPSRTPSVPASDPPAV